MTLNQSKSLQSTMSLPAVENTRPKRECKPSLRKRAALEVFNDKYKYRPNVKNCQLLEIKTEVNEVSNKQEIKLTSQMKTKRKLFRCTVCQKKLPGSLDLKEHMKVHVVKTFNCTECDKSYYRKDHLVCHLRTHTGDKPYACHFCCKRFTRSDYVSKHLRIHVGRTPFKCDICGKRFKTKMNLNRHNYEHLRQGQYPLTSSEKNSEAVYSHCCEVCGMKFTMQSALKDHKSEHCKQISIALPYCKEYFSNNSRFGEDNEFTKNISEMCNSNNDPRHASCKPQILYECPYCDMRFPHKSLLRRHLTDVHIMLEVGESETQNAVVDLEVDNFSIQEYTQVFEILEDDLNDKSITSSEGVNVTFRCVLCQHTCDNLVSLKDHLKTHPEYSTS